MLFTLRGVLMLNRLDHHSIKFLIVCFLLHSILYAAPPDTLWTRVFGGDSTDRAKSICQTSDGGFAIAGYTNSFGNGYYDVYVIRLDMNGDTLWTRTYGGDTTDIGSSIQQTEDGGFIIAGSTLSFGQGMADIYLIKINSKGDSLWSKTFGQDSLEYSRAVRVMDDGGYVITGETKSFNSLYGDVILIRTDANGDTLWTKVYKKEQEQWGHSVKVTDDGGFIIVGQSLEISMVFYIIRANSIGDSIWTRTFDIKGYDQGYSVQQLNDGGFIFVGSAAASNVDQDDVAVMRLNKEGETLWTKLYGGKYSDEARSICPTDDGNFIISGSTFSINSYDGDFYLIKINDNGDTLWTGMYDGGDNEEARASVPTNDGGFIVVGDQGSPLGVTDIYVMRFDKETTAVKRPFNAHLLTKSELQKIEKVELYDLMGRKIKTIPWKAYKNKKYKNGIYIVRYVGNNFSKQMKNVMID